MYQQKAIENYSRIANENFSTEKGVENNFWLLNLLLNFNYAENQARVEIELEEIKKAEMIINAKLSAFNNVMVDEKRTYGHPTSLLDLDISISQSERDILSEGQ